jgi:cytochrome b6-f complex iron-sulfur subunit
MRNRTRRNFLGICAGGGAAIFMSSASYIVYRYLSPKPADNQQVKMEFVETDVAAGEAKFFEFAGKSAVLVRRRDGSLVALSAVCTHLGCVVQWQQDKEQFLCPCHAGVFSIDGKVLGGPPPKPLQVIPVTTAAGGRVVVG